MFSLPPTYLILAPSLYQSLFYRPQQRAPSRSFSVPWRTLWSQGVTTWTVACTTTPCGSPSLLTTRDWPRNSGNQQKELLLPVGQNNCEWDSLLFVSAEWRIMCTLNCMHILNTGDDEFHISHCDYRTASDNSWHWLRLGFPGSGGSRDPHLI